MTAFVPFEIQPLTSEHLAEVLHIEALSATSHAWTRGIFEDELAQVNSRVYRVVVSDGNVVAFGGVLVQVGEAHITNIAVAPTWRRRGIAAVLLAELLRLAQQRGAGSATLEVRTSNAGAVALYEKFGFVSAGVRPGYYPDREDAIIMWADETALGVITQLEANEDSL
jgi:[ribosomal protein S18]-alanine N-acetyltransferase